MLLIKIITRPATVWYAYVAREKADSKAQLVLMRNCRRVAIECRVVTAYRCRKLHICIYYIYVIAASSSMRHSSALYCSVLKLEFILTH